ncbi:MAG: radical SAM protein [Desulfobacteraceae bacterium]|nr:MAG: radical SAM protein [Desulfobacteraceae bacterium]
MTTFKTILIFPAISGVGFNSFGKGMEESWISHGLCLISAYAKKAGHDIGLFDLRRLKGWDHFKTEMEKANPNVVGITMMSVDYNPVVKCIDIIKEIDSSIKIVVGGPHPSIAPQEILKIEKVDYVIKGEGEISFVELLENLRKGNPPSERLIEGKKPILDDLPFADRTLFGSLEYPPPVKGFHPPFVSIIAGRGCLFNCSFCQPAERAIFGAKVRRRSVENVIAELLELKNKFDFKSMMIHDDCLTEDRQWVHEFCKKYRTEIQVPFACQSRADIICREETMLEELYAAGLRLFFIGFESGNQRILNFLRKGIKVEQNYRAAELCRKHKIKIWANYMLGLPTETKDEIMDTVKMIRTIKPDHYSPAFFTPHPGSDLFNYCEEHGLSLIKNHDSYRRNATECKIKGVDYEFLFWALNESMGLNVPLLNPHIVLKMKNNLRPFFKKFPVLKTVAASLWRNIKLKRS